MINHNLEEDLRSFCVKTLAGEDINELYESGINMPLHYLASEICSKRKIARKQLADGIIEDMVSDVVTKLPTVYDSTKGMAKCTTYVLMQHYLDNRTKRDRTKKRDETLTVYIEDLENSDENVASLIEVEIDLLQLKRNTLLQNKRLFNTIKTKLHRKIAEIILSAIENPNKFKDNQNSFTVDIARKSHTNIQQVYATLKLMRGIVEKEPVFQV